MLSLKRNIIKIVVQNFCVMFLFIPFFVYANTDSQLHNVHNVSSNIQMATHVVNVFKIKDGEYEMNTKVNIANENVRRGVIRTSKSCVIENELVAISFVAGKGKVPFMKSLKSFKVCPVLEIKGKI